MTRMKDLHATWMQDGSYRKEHDALEGHEIKLSNLRAALLAGEESGPSEPFDFEIFIQRKLASTRGT